MTIINIVTTFTLIIGFAGVLVGIMAIGIKVENWLYVENGKVSFLGIGGGIMLIATSFLPEAIDENFIYANIGFLALLIYLLYDLYKLERTKKNNLRK